MPNAPNVDGLPLWLQVVVSLAFVFATASAAFIGYRRRVDREPPGAAQTVIASIPDMGPMRHLSDVCAKLAACVESLESSVRDHTHYLRIQSDLERETCQRLRELRELGERLEKQFR